MFGKKVVIKFKDGRIIKGWTANFAPNKEIFHLYKDEEFGEKDKKDVVEVKLSSLKVVFFVKEHKGNKDYKLISCCLHMGGRTRGHYVSYTLHRDTWYLKDDDKVVKQKPSLNSSYYFCIYKSHLMHL